MARGLMTQRKAPAAPPPAPEPADDAEGAGDADASQEGQEAAGGPAQGQGQPGASSGRAATPEQQQSYNAFLLAAMRIIYTQGPDGKPRVQPVIIEKLKFREGQQPPESDQAVAALASLTVMVETRVEAAAQQHGQPVSDPAVLYHAGTEIMGDLATIAEKARIYNYSPKEISGAWVRAVDLYQQQKTQSGELAASKPALQHDWGQITGAARAGNLDSIVPGISGAAKMMAPQGKGMGGRKPPPPAAPAPDQGGP